MKGRLQRETIRDPGKFHSQVYHECILGRSAIGMCLLPWYGGSRGCIEGTWRFLDFMIIHVEIGICVYSRRHLKNATGDTSETHVTDSLSG